LDENNRDDSERRCAERPDAHRREQETGEDGALPGIDDRHLCSIADRDQSCAHNEKLVPRVLLGER